MPLANANRLLGRVQRVLSGFAGKQYGFILTDDYQKFFAHQDDVIGQRMPPEGSLVTFDVLKQTSRQKRDRAVNIQIETMPQ
jgi:cold shock CspA family protein